ncbi:hypothetical protein DWQ65_13005 [Treponema phagedenis]|uniref:hypothetical protein n=2 Tax=Treponema phagedenis TaxID=162 RepID=UPI0001F6406D|nr:hypothetical protein [Treponema phagedenis]EFW37420.1 hypothetical protein HMPREF9554_02093 [Treponema phagedenis F0421]QSI00962.1 hypothetical protein DWQ65_13005 [Treponema phagedenis]
MTRNHNQSMAVPHGTGERAAMGGYLPQYDEFARRVYACIIEGSLEEIRVADAEENVGKLDDICYITTSEVHAYQVKWTNVESTITFLDFKKLLPEIVVGWRKLKQLYSDKKVIPYLLTNKECSLQDKSVQDATGKKIGSFSEYVIHVIDRLHNELAIEGKWKSVILELESFSKLAPEEWKDFWTSFVFKHNYKYEDIDVSYKHGSQRTSDLIDLNRMIQQMVASPQRHVIASAQEILNKLGWIDRIKTKYNHNLLVTSSSYEPNTSALV